ncbi:hypothetical protein CHUAL_007393 [Chamberlinius hualienensis]
MSRRIDLRPRNQLPPKTPWKRNCACKSEGQTRLTAVAGGNGEKNCTSADSKIARKTNFVHGNIWDAINSVAQTAPTMRVDTRYGAKQLLKNSGLQRQFAVTKDYGKVPLYLIKRKHEHKIEQKNHKSYIAAKQQQSVKNRISDEERLDILKGLKDNWNILNRQYLSISLTVDTYHKKMRKNVLETRMKQLENDMQIFENDNVFIMGN